jgi:hypothetical protein
LAKTPYRLESGRKDPSSDRSADNFDGAIGGLAKDQTPVADAKAVPRRIEALQLLYVAGIGYQEPRQRLEQP